MLLAFVAIPVVIHRLGVAEFGVLSVCWAVVGYMALFDLGFEPGPDKTRGRQIGHGPPRGNSIPLLDLSSADGHGFGVLGGAALGIAAPAAVLVLNIPQSLGAVTLVVFQILSLTVPLVILNSALQGFLAAYQRFDLITAVRVPASAAVFLCPLVVLPFSRSLVLIVALMLVTRAMATLAYLLLCLRVCPRLLHEPRIARRHLRPLISFGGWVAVTNFLGPLMLYGDRFLVSARLSISALAYYVTPYGSSNQTATNPERHRASASTRLLQRPLVVLPHVRCSSSVAAPIDFDDHRSGSGGRGDSRPGRAGALAGAVVRRQKRVSPEMAGDRRAVQCDRVFALHADSGCRPSSRLGGKVERD